VLDGWVVGGGGTQREISRPKALLLCIGIVNKQLLHDGSRWVDSKVAGRVVARTMASAVREASLIAH
jgi:hypothetical protein